MASGISLCFPFSVPEFRIQTSNIFQFVAEMMGTASELRAKIGKLKKRRMEESKLTKVEKLHTNGDISHHHKGRILKLLF